MEGVGAVGAGPRGLGREAVVMGWAAGFGRGCGDGAAAAKLGRARGRVPGFGEGRNEGLAGELCLIFCKLYMGHRCVGAGVIYT